MPQSGASRGQRAPQDAKAETAVLGRIRASCSPLTVVPPTVMIGRPFQGAPHVRSPAATESRVLFHCKSARGVPIHSALVDLVARRTKGKHGADDLFPEYPVPKRSTSQRERSFRASNEFTEYRRSVGVEEVVKGRRRSLVNFHSFRRYFITKAEQADQMEHIIAVVVGHKRTGMTLGRYSGGPLLEQARRCVEAVKLP
jgi:integrase